MDNTQNNQPNTDKDQQISPLGEIELESLRLKFEGFTYKEMADRLRVRFGENGPADSTLRMWFATGGKLKEFYRDYAETEAKIRRVEARDVFRAQLKDAVRILVTLMKESPMDTVRIQAAKEIINRELGEPLKVVVDPGKTNIVKEILAEAGLIQQDGEQQKDNT